MSTMHCFKELKSGKSPQKHIPENKWVYIDEDEDYRKVIYDWSEKRHQDFRGCRRSYHYFLLHTFRLDVLVSFLKGFNYMVFIHMILAAFTVYIFQVFEFGFEMNVMIFVSPIVFPLAFSINADFQRRERVLNDLAVFKSSSLSFFFTMRDWNKVIELDMNWFKSIHFKVKSLLFNLREYLLTEKYDRQQLILRAIYEDFSDLNQLVETLRTSNIPITNGLVAGPIYSLKEMTLAFERLRNVREYQSPRSIRAFTKVFIFLMPIIFAPYFVYLGDKVSDKLSWPPYFLGVLTSFVFGALQGVQDKLNDPFNGMNEDVLKISTIDDWAFQYLDVIVNRTYKIGRFQVTTSNFDHPSSSSIEQSSRHINKTGILTKENEVNECNNKTPTLRNSEKNFTSKTSSFHEKYSDILNKTPGDVLINRSLIPFSKREKNRIKCNGETSALLENENSINTYNIPLTSSEHYRHSVGIQNCQGSEDIASKNGFSLENIALAAAQSSSLHDIDHSFDNSFVNDQNNIYENSFLSKISLPENLFKTDNDKVGICSNGRSKSTFL